jgi:hypothetical protein
VGFRPGLDLLLKKYLFPAESQTMSSGLWSTLDASASPAETLVMVGHKQNTVALLSVCVLL